MAAEASVAARAAQSPEMRREYENLVRAWEELIREMESADQTDSSVGRGR